MKPYYEHAGITIYHGDCREWLAGVPTCFRVDACITDPPYGCGVKYGPSYDDTPGPEYWRWLRSCVDLMRAHSTVVAFTHRNAALKELQADWVGVWNKPGSFGARVGNSPIVPHWEPIFFWGIHALGVRGEMLPDVLTFNPEQAGNNSAIGRDKWRTDQFADHPCPKPIGLYSQLVRTLCPDRTGVVMDPFSGSGTTLRAAKDLGLKAVGIEIEERYCEIAAQRLSQEVLPMFGETA